MDKQKVGAIAGLGLVVAVGYYLYASTQPEETTIGGSGSFTGLGGSEGLLTGDNAALAGTSDSGINYNISLPPVDTSGIANLLSEPISGAPGNVISSPKETEVVSKKSVSSGTPSGSVGSSKTLDSLAGSLGRVSDILTGKAFNGALPTGASTRSSEINLPSSSQLKEIASKKQAASQAAGAIAESGYGKTLFSPIKSSKNSVSPSVSSTKKSNTISLAEAKKGSSRFSTPSTGKVIKVKR